MNKGLTLLAASLVTASAGSVTSLSGPIKDWASGETGSVQLYVGNLAPNNLDYLQALTTAPVDAAGNFKLTLPDAKAVAPALMPKGSTYKLNVPCEGSLKVEPAAALNFFDLAGYDSFGLRLTNMRLGSTRMERLKPGDSLNILVYAATPTQLSGSSRCEQNASGVRTSDALHWTWDAKLAAGWNVLNVAVTEFKDSVLQAKITTKDLAKTDAWMLYIGRGGLRMDAVDGTDGRVHFSGIQAGGAAAQAGLKDGDVPLEIDGVSVKGWSFMQVAEKVRGEPGTKVVIKVLRGDQEVTVEGVRQFYRSN